MSLTHDQEARTMFNPPEGHPPIPDGGPVGDSVAIVTVQDPHALHT